MHLSPSAHVDTFARDHLPPSDQWPTIEFTTDALHYADRLNAGVELVDVPALRVGEDAPALRTPDGVIWTYGELRRRSDQVAQVLVEDLGLVTGNRVLLRSPNNPWTVAVWLGVLKAGGVVVTTMAALRARELGPIVERTRPVVALVDHRFADDVVAVRDSSAPDLVVVPYGGSGGRRPHASRRGQVGRVHRGWHGGGRRRPVRSHLGEHRRSQDHDALPPRRVVHRQHLRQDTRARPGRSRGLHGPARLHLRPGHARGLRAARRGMCTPDRTGDAGAARGPRRRAGSHRPGDGSDGVQADPQVRQDRPALRAASRGERWRAHSASRLGADP